MHDSIDFTQSLSAKEIKDTIQTVSTLKSEIIEQIKNEYDPKIQDLINQNVELKALLQIS